MTNTINNLFASLLNEDFGAFAEMPAAVDEPAAAAVDELAVAEVETAEVPAAVTPNVKPETENEAKWLRGALLNKNGQFVLTAVLDWDGRDTECGQCWNATYRIAKIGNRLFRIGRKLAERLLEHGNAVISTAEIVKTGAVTTNTVYKF